MGGARHNLVSCGYLRPMRAIVLDLALLIPTSFRLTHLGEARALRRCPPDSYEQFLRFQARRMARVHPGGLRTGRSPAIGMTPIVSRVRSQGAV